MKKSLSVILAICFIPLILNTPSNAQAQALEGDYMHIDYIHIEKDKIAEFTTKIETKIKKVQQARVESDGLKEWYMYRVAYPGSQNTNHNFVSVSICSYICSFDDFNDLIFDHFPVEEATQLIKDYRSLMIPNHSELWKINNSVTRENNLEPARYFNMDYMRVISGMEYAYQMMEDEIARPIHEQRMENDTMEAWQLFSLIIPGGSQYGYNYATGNYYKNLSDFEFGFSDAIIRQTHPDTNVNEIFENIDRTRDAVRREIWQLVDYVKNN